MSLPNEALSFLNIPNEIILYIGEWTLAIFDRQPRPLGRFRCTCSRINTTLEEVMDKAKCLPFLDILVQYGEPMEHRDLLEAYKFRQFGEFWGEKNFKEWLESQKELEILPDKTNESLFYVAIKGECSIVESWILWSPMLAREAH